MGDINKRVQPTLSRPPKNINKNKGGSSGYGRRDSYASYPITALVGGTRVSSGRVGRRPTAEAAGAAIGAPTHTMLPHAQRTLAETNFYTILLAYAPSALAIC